MLITRDADFALALAGEGNVEGRLHAHECVHLGAEGFLDTQGHVAGHPGYVPGRLDSTRSRPSAGIRFAGMK